MHTVEETENNDVWFVCWQAKLLEQVYTVKRDYDAHCRGLETQSPDRALEYGIHAQAHLNQLYSRVERDMDALQRDYQQKMTKMAESLEETFQKDQEKVLEKEVASGLQIKIHRKATSKWNTASFQAASSQIPQIRKSLKFLHAS